MHVALINWKLSAEAQTEMWMGDIVGFNNNGEMRAR